MRQVNTPAARNSDPITSHLAAEVITRSGKRNLQRIQTALAVQAQPGHTSSELSWLLELDRYMIARRLSECVTAGVVRKGPKRTCGVSGLKALTWYPTEV